jgi:hypothetical protein
VAPPMPMLRGERPSVSPSCLKVGRLGLASALQAAGTGGDGLDRPGQILAQIVQLARAVFFVRSGLQLGTDRDIDGRGGEGHAAGGRAGEDHGGEKSFVTHGSAPHW